MPLISLAEKNETTFYKAVNRKLDKSIFFEKMSNPFRSGIPDFYYEGPTGKVIWVEYKWIEKEWETSKSPSEICPHKSWIQQRRWLERAHNRGVGAYTIVGIGKGKNAKAYLLSHPFNFIKNYDLAGSLDDLANFFHETLECNSPTQNPM